MKLPKALRANEVYRKSGTYVTGRGGNDMAAGVVAQSHLCSPQNFDILDALPDAELLRIREFSTECERIVDSIRNQRAARLDAEVARINRNDGSALPDPYDRSSGLPR